MARKRHLLAPALLLVGVVGVLVARSGGPDRVIAACTVRVADQLYALTPEQGENATTIATEAHRLALPDHAVSVGLAAALQESKLRNLTYGDRDSLGLFQQRESQGWGTPQQIMDTSYASAAFFKALAKVDGWEQLEVYRAAQEVQRSADGSAYAAWDGEARAFAQGLTGESPGAYSCQYPSIPKARPTSLSSLTSDVTAALGPVALTAPVQPSYGWLVASWIVSRAPHYSVSSVTYGGKRWRPDGKGWQADASVTGRAANMVQVAVRT